MMTNCRSFPCPGHFQEVTDSGLHVPKPLKYSNGISVTNLAALRTQLNLFRPLNTYSSLSFAFLGSALQLSLSWMFIRLLYDLARLAGTTRHFNGIMLQNNLDPKNK